MIYATRQSHNGIVAENSTIVSFADQAAAESWLMAGHSVGLHPRIAPGRFQSCWRRTETPGPIEVAASCAPFELNQIETKGPGDHVGNYFALTPTAEVLVLLDVPPGDG